MPIDLYTVLEEADNFQTIRLPAIPIHRPRVNSPLVAEEQGSSSSSLPFWKDVTDKTLKTNTLSGREGSQVSQSKGVRSIFLPPDYVLNTVCHHFHGFLVLLGAHYLLSLFCGRFCCIAPISEPCLLAPSVRIRRRSEYFRSACIPKALVTYYSQKYKTQEATSTTVYVRSAQAITACGSAWR